MRLVLDAGAFLAVERGDRLTIRLVDVELKAGRAPLPTAASLVRYDAGGSRQARLAKLLPGVTITPLDEALGRRAGALLAKARKTDVVDAAVILLAGDGDTILTSDPTELEPLAFAAGLQVDVVAV